MINLGNFPTPVEKLETLSKEFNKEIYLKRDDFSGIEVTGNKIRKLEYIFDYVIKEGYEGVITEGAIQSNHCRATAAAAAKLGLECNLVLSGKEPEIVEGNYFYDKILGAKIHLVPEEDMRKPKMKEIKENSDKKLFVVPTGASTPLGSLGYVDSFNELTDEVRGLDLIVVTVGSGGTYAGLYKGIKDSGLDIDLLGISVSESAEFFENEIKEILKGMDEDIDLTDIWIDDNYVGLGYGKTTDEELRKIVEVAQKEGVIFDPCYTGKAFIGLLDYLEKDKLKDYKKIAFVHTGGIFGWTEEMREMFLNLK